MSALPTAKNAQRPPAQARGKVRMAAILEATAQMVAENGTASVTMHLAAKRSGTSIGSIYHFFPDRDCLLQALVEQHAQAIGDINQAFDSTTPTHWQALTPESAIAHLITPYIAYVHQHPDFLAFVAAVDQQQGAANFRRTLHAMLTARLPQLAEPLRQDYACLMHSIATGTMLTGFQSQPAKTAFYLQEVPRVLAAYLRAIETTHALPRA